jgi:hypothetical protein
MRLPCLSSAALHMLTDRPQQPPVYTLGAGSTTANLLFDFSSAEGDARDGAGRESPPGDASDGAQGDAGAAPPHERLDRTSGAGTRETAGGGPGSGPGVGRQPAAAPPPQTASPYQQQVFCMGQAASAPLLYAGGRVSLAGDNERGRPPLMAAATTLRDRGGRPQVIRTERGGEVTYHAPGQVGWATPLECL